MDSSLKEPDGHGSFDEVSTLNANRSTMSGGRHPRSYHFGFAVNNAEIV